MSPNSKSTPEFEQHRNVVSDVNRLSDADMVAGAVALQKGDSGRFKFGVVRPYAAVVVISVLSFALAGAAWGLLRPAITATAIDTERLEIHHSENVEFHGYVLAVGIIAVLAIILGAGVFAALPHKRDPIMQVWLGFWAWIGAIVMIRTGNYVSSWLRGIRVEDMHPGNSLSFVPWLDPGLSAYLVAPLMAMLLYFSCLLVGESGTTGDDE